MSNNNWQIRDPLHGVIFISALERHIIDSPIFQRLRNIKQVGFADFAFPGATHTRYAHSLGAMHVASRIFDRIFSDESLSVFDHKRFRQLVRLAALLHDLGHPPLSHTTEMIMPVLKNLERQANHEDYTLLLIRDSELGALINTYFADIGLSSEHVARLLQKDFRDQYFYANNIDYGPVLSQIISSEIDADRMDYLQRDSFFCGVNYGKFDSHWLIENLIKVTRDNKAFLGLRARAIFAFEDFLLSRYHMFVSVYLHHTPVIMEKMLERFFIECPDDFTLPSDPQAYSALDDMNLWHALRQSSNQWARRIVYHEPYVMLAERCESLQVSLDENAVKLAEKGIDIIVARSKSILSNYAHKHTCELFVESESLNLVSLHEYSQIFTRYEKPVEFVRIFVDRKDLVNAQRIIS
jgi:HD superfamily phosphohydrolase